MKRIMLLSFALLLLFSGCAAKGEMPATKAVQQLTITKGSDGHKIYHDGYENIEIFYDSCMEGKPMELTIHTITEEGDFSTHVLFDGKRYTVTDEKGEKTYPYLVYSVLDTQEDSSRIDGSGYYLLSDDPEMTAQRYWDYMISSMLVPSFPDTYLLFCDFK